MLTKRTTDNASRRRWGPLVCLLLPTHVTRGHVMHVRLWGELDDRLIEVRVESSADAPGLLIVGLPKDLARTTADRVRAALVNSGLLQEVPTVSLRLHPSIVGWETSRLDLGDRLGRALRDRVDRGRAPVVGRQWAPGTRRLGPGSAFRYTKHAARRGAVPACRRLFRRPDVSAREEDRAPRPVAQGHG